MTELERHQQKWAADAGLRLAWADITTSEPFRAAVAFWKAKTLHENEHTNLELAPAIIDRRYHREQGALQMLSFLTNLHAERKGPPVEPEPFAHYNTAKTPEPPP